MKTLLFTSLLAVNAAAISLQENSLCQVSSDEDFYAGIDYIEEQATTLIPLIDNVEDAFEGGDDGSDDPFSDALDIIEDNA